MHLHVQKDADSLSLELAEWIIADIQKTLVLKERYALVLSGGSTPKKLYELLASGHYRDRIDWQKIDFFWGDERYVPFDDERNNGKMAYDTLLKHVPVLQSQVYLMDTTQDPESSAQEYEKILRRYFDNQPATFDLVLLGMGDDGHTLSLFPGTPVVHEQKKWVAAPYVQAQEMYRITLTAPVVNLSAAVAFLVSGEKKAQTLQAVINGEYHPDVYPSQVIQPRNGNLHWFIDAAAGNLLVRE